MSNQMVTMKLGNNSAPVLGKFWLFPKPLGEEIISLWTEGFHRDEKILNPCYALRLFFFKFCYWYLSDRCDLAAICEGCFTSLDQIITDFLQMWHLQLIYWKMYFCSTVAGWSAWHFLSFILILYPRFYLPNLSSIIFAVGLDNLQLFSKRTFGLFYSPRESDDWKCSWDGAWILPSYSQSVTDTIGIDS